MYFHLKYHPQDPPARDIQHIWEHTVAKFHGQPNLNTMKNYDGAKTPIDSLIVAYSRPLNLRNSLYALSKTGGRQFHPSFKTNLPPLFTHHMGTDFVSSNMLCAQKNITPTPYLPQGTTISQIPHTPNTIHTYHLPLTSKLQYPTP